MFLLRLTLSYASWFFSLRNLSLSKLREGEEMEVPLALVFLGMMLRKEQDIQKKNQKGNKKNQGQTAS